MNWLYPNFLRKIDHYLKINYPHVWRTRVHDFGWFSLVLGNVLAIISGILVVSRNNIISEDELLTMNVGLAVLLGFVSLFWVVRLVRFKLKFSDIEMLLTTWLIYVFCLLSLGLNLVTFTSAVAYRTACLYSENVVEEDYDYMHSTFWHYRYDGPSHGSPYNNNSRLRNEYLTKDLSVILSRYGYEINKKIHRWDVNELIDRISVLKSAKIFIKQPVLGSDYTDYKKKTFYHKLLNDGWIFGIMLLFFLPALLFLLSSFGMKNVLVSAFCTTILVFLGAFLMNISNAYDPEPLLATYVAIVFMLTMLLMSGGNKVRSWNYIAGTTMLMYGVVFLMGVVVSINSAHVRFVAPDENHLLAFAVGLSVALFVLFVVSWFVTKYKYQPVLK